jgi:lipoprotein-releasing system permease protein
MKLAFNIAWRFLTSSLGQTILITLGIAIGVSVQVFIGSLISGLQKDLVETTIGSSSQVTVKPKNRESKISNYNTIINKIKSTQEKITNISPAADAPGFIRNGSNTFPILARGFDLNAAEGIYKLKNALISGTLPSSGEIILGKELMTEAGLKVGDKVEILTPQGKAKETTISGIYDLKVSSLNRSWVISNTPLVQEIFDYGDTVTSIETQLTEVFEADVISESISSILSSDLKVENWKEQNASLLGGLNGQSISSLMIQIFVLVSVILGISSVLAISVLQKSKQLGILKAIGIKNRTTSFIFLFQGLILGIFGSILGVSLGLGLSTAFTKFALNPDGTPVIALFIDPQFIIISGLIAVLSSAIASLIPAIRSSKLDPMEVIKNG